MIFGILLVRIQEATKVEELVPYLVNEDYVVRLAASSKLKQLTKNKGDLICTSQATNTKRH